MTHKQLIHLSWWPSQFYAKLFRLLFSESLNWSSIVLFHDLKLRVQCLILDKVSRGKNIEIKPQFDMTGNGYINSMSNTHNGLMVQCNRHPIGFEITSQSPVLAVNIDDRSHRRSGVARLIYGLCRNRPIIFSTTETCRHQQLALLSH